MNHDEIRDKIIQESSHSEEYLNVLKNNIDLEN